MSVGALKFTFIFHYPKECISASRHVESTFTSSSVIFDLAPPNFRPSMLPSVAQAGTQNQNYHQFIIISNNIHRHRSCFSTMAHSRLPDCVYQRLRKQAEINVLVHRQYIAWFVLDDSKRMAFASAPRQIKRTSETIDSSKYSAYLNSRLR